MPTLENKSRANPKKTSKPSLALGGTSNSLGEESAIVILPRERRTTARQAQCKSRNVRVLVSAIIMAGLLKECHVEYDEAKRLTSAIVKELLK